MAKRGLATGMSRLKSAVKSQYPHLSDKELEQISGIILEEISRRVDAGEKLAFLKRNADGNVELTVLGLEVLDKKKHQASATNR